MNGLPLISLMLAMPALGVMGALIGGGRDGAGARTIALLSSTVTFVLSLVLWVGYDPSGGQIGRAHV